MAYIAILSGCSSPKQTQTTPERKPVKTIDKELPSENLSIAKSKRLLMEQPFNLPELIGHVEQYIVAERYQEARALLMTLAPYLPDTLYDRTKTLMAIATASSTKLPPESMLEWLATPLQNQALDESRKTILIKTLKLNGNELEAMALQAEQNDTDTATHHQIYANLSTISNADLQAIANKFASLRPHVALMQLIRTIGNDLNNFEVAIAQFQKVYFQHPLTQPLPDSIIRTLNIEPSDIQRITVMLPLSGRFESTGNAIKQGILAAYFAQQSNTNIELSFVDTAVSDQQALVSAANQADWVIGPLLKENIDKLLPLIKNNTGKLVLNRPEGALIYDYAKQSKLENVSFFGLAPEDEAIQIAEHVANNGYKNPIVVASNIDSSKRMLNAFVHKWNSLHNYQQNSASIDVVTFNDIDGLDDSLARALGVAQSENNANQIDRMTNRILFDQTRSRQDLDAIVVFASPEQMALVNPMVEASISPFRQQVVPVFAASRSIEIDTAKNTLRDLENVHFLDAPLILHKQQWPDINATIEQLWPNQSARFSRLFAFGFDAYAMLPKLPLINTLTGYQYSGMSGLLQMNSNSQINRHLPMAQINQQSISLLEE